MACLALCHFRRGDLLDRPYDVRHPAEAFDVKVGDEFRQGSLPPLLTVVRELPEILRIHPKLTRHLHLHMGQVPSPPCIDPRLEAVRDEGLVHFTRHWHGLSPSPSQRRSPPRLALAPPPAARRVAGSLQRRRRSHGNPCGNAGTLSLKSNKVGCASKQAAVDHKASVTLGSPAATRAGAHLRRNSRSLPRRAPRLSREERAGDELPNGFA